MTVVGMAKHRAVLILADLTRLVACALAVADVRQWNRQLVILRLAIPSFRWFAML
jgi:hypothetical protein